MNNLKRIVLVLVVILVAFVLLYPTVKWYYFVSDEEKDLAVLTSEQIREYAQFKADQDVKELLALASENVAITAELKYIETLTEDTGTKNESVVDLLNDFASREALFRACENYYKESVIELKNLSSKVLQLGLDLKGGISVLLQADVESFEEKIGHSASDAEILAALNQNIEILGHRLDEFGLSEPEIRLQSNDQILIELPGQADSSRVDSFLQGKGSLAFQIVDSAMTKEVNAYYEENPDKQYLDDGSLFVPSFIPKDKLLLPYYTKDSYDIDRLEYYVVVDPNVALDGNYIVDATPSKDQMTQRPVVNFTLSVEGGNKFSDLTRENKGKALAVNLDSKIRSVATINDTIGSSGQISGFTEKEAQDLAIVLKTASFAIDLDIVSLQTVGASLGEDTVKVGLYSILIGLALIILFIVLYYGFSGVVASIAIILNLFFMVSVLSSLSFTLTLTAIAGLILTLGMAVDANVIIYERIKEELRAYRSPYKAVQIGYSKAFWTIMDSNITTIIAALVLSTLGSSSVKGFAVTLAIGIVCSLFTSLYVSHLIFDLFVKENSDNISILPVWRRKK